MSVEASNIIQAFSKLNPALIQSFKKLLFHTPSNISDESFIKIFKDRLNDHEKGCPRCGSSQRVKNGRNRIYIQSYRCKGCGKYYSDSTDTLTRYSKKPIPMWMQYMEGMCEGLSIRESSKTLGISINTAFYWRHKILMALKMRLSDNLSGIIEIDNINIAESFKGNHSKDKDFSMGRAPRKRGMTAWEKLTAKKVNIICCKDRSEGILSQVTGYISPGSKILYEILESRITKGSTICALHKICFTSLSKKLKLKLIKLTGRHISYKDIYHMENASAFSRDFEKFLLRFRGVATKYMNFYITWFKWLDTAKNFVTDYRAVDLFTISAKVNKGLRVRDFKTVCPVI